MEEEEQSFSQINYAPGYPKRVEVSCTCHVQNVYARQHARPAEVLCARCQAWQAWFEKQYLEECEKAGILPVEIQGALGV